MAVVGPGLVATIDARRRRNVRPFQLQASAGVAHIVLRRQRNRHAEQHFGNMAMCLRVACLRSNLVVDCPWFISGTLILICAMFFVDFFSRRIINNMDEKGIGATLAGASIASVVK